MRALSRETARPGCRGLLTACQAGGQLDKLLRRHFLLRNLFKRGPASETTPFITYGPPPVPQVNSPAAWKITSVDFDSLQGECRAAMAARHWQTCITWALHRPP